MKFERGHSVKESLNLGIFSLKEFDSDEKAMHYIFHNLETILEGSEGQTIIEKIEYYVSRHVKVDDGFSGIDWIKAGKADPSLMYLIVQHISPRADEIQKRFRS
jgi:hypothetical protein